ITVVPMPSPALPSPPRAPVPGRVLFLGRLVARKGAHVLLEAFARLAPAQPDATLRIVGDGPERRALEARAATLGLADRVTFVGAVAPSAVADEYARAAVFAMPAITDWKGEQEGFGLVLVEAMRAGLPVVASASGGIGDIVRDGETGRLVAEGDAGALADALTALLARPADAARLGDAGRRDVTARYAPEAIARTFDAVYRRAVA
nr:glycosyltransferase [Gemmatimonadaceae bacterium]